MCLTYQLLVICIAKVYSDSLESDKCSYPKAVNEIIIFHLEGIM
jgi:hypothetical protein